MINRVTLVGRLTRDPELRYTTNGVAVTRFNVAVNRNYTNKDGEREADFINIVTWRKQAENCAEYLHKGSLVGVDGRIQTGRYENQEGQMVYTTDVLAESVQFLEPKGKDSKAKSGAGKKSQPHYDDPFADDGEPINIFDEDLPF